MTTLHEVAKSPPKIDPVKAEACERMENVVETIHVTIEECQAMLRKGEWPEALIALVFKDHSPARVQMRSTMLVVRPAKERNEKEAKTR